MYEILILPLIAGVAIAQTMKFFIKSNHQSFQFKNIAAYSGMPSGHSAMVISLATILGLRLGWDSPIFAFSAIFAIIVIRDALGIRSYLGEHGRILNILVKDLKNDHVLDEKYPTLIEKIGHTPAQVIVGSLIGFLTSLIGYWLI
jgi:uncharacterized protein